MVTNPTILMLLLMIIITTLATPSTQAAPGQNLQQQIIIAKPGCNSSCGNVSIPYPFGMGSRQCFFNDMFQVYCRNSKKPFLKFNAQEIDVLEIDPESSTLRVNNPIRFSNCPSKGPLQEAVNLTKTPFVFSQGGNRFTAVNCDSIAYMKAPYNDSKTVGACMSICDKELGAGTSCNGMNCCQTTIPKDLKEFKTTFDVIYYNRIGDCRYAFLVDQEWFQSSKHGRSYSDMAHMENVPVVLEWRLCNWTAQEFGPVFESKTMDGYYQWRKLNDFYCRSDNSAHRNDCNSSLQCFCGQGFEGNPYIKQCRDICLNNPGSNNCYTPLRNTSSKKLISGLGVGFGLLILTLAAWCLHGILRKRKRVKRKEKFFKRNGGLLLQQQMSSANKVNVEQAKIFTSKELKKATDNFSLNRILGQGGQGIVFKGMLSDGKIVAVKMSKQLDEGKITEFINEIVILSQINHRNVVKVLGCCLETEVPLLVYEYIPNGTLAEYIHGKNDEFIFTWKIRLRVATEIANALSYLHSSTSSPIYHRDIKSVNILMDEKYRAKIADFGTSKSVNIDQTHVTTRVLGTFGYLDPEYFQTNQFTDKSDVYSFGVLLVELLTGQKAIPTTKMEEGGSLVTYFIISMQQNQLFDILDANVLEGPRDEILVFANIAKRCLNLNSRKRPSMRDVAVELEGIELSKRALEHTQTQHYDESQYVRTHEIEPWDVVSTSNELYSNNNSCDCYEFPLVHHF